MIERAYSATRLPLQKSHRLHELVLSLHALEPFAEIHSIFLALLKM